MSKNTMILALIGNMIVYYRAGRVLVAAVELGVFDALVAGPMSGLQVAAQIQADPRSTEILLDALASLELLEKHGDCYANTEAGRCYLASDGSHSLASNLRYQQLLAHAWADLPDVIRSGQPRVALGRLLAENPVFTEQYIRGMADISRNPAEELAAGLDLSEARDALDVGGGPGTYSRALAERGPGLRVVLLDLEPTLQIARQCLAESSVRDRIEFRAGDYHTADYGHEAFDLILFSHVTHDEGESENREMLRKAYRALRPGGRVVIHDFMLDPTRTGPLFGTLFSVHMLTYTQKGRTYSAEEYGGWVLECGFELPRQIDICASQLTTTRAIIATKP